MAEDCSQTLEVIKPLLDFKAPNWELWKAYQLLHQEFAEKNYTDREIRGLLVEYGVDPEEYEACVHPKFQHFLTVDLNYTTYLLLGTNYRYDIYGAANGDDDQACQRYLSRLGESDPNPHWYDCMFYSIVNSDFLENPLRERPFFRIPPIGKTKTRIAMLASSMDTVTTPHRAYKSFHAITGSPWKV